MLTNRFPKTPALLEISEDDLGPELSPMTRAELSELSPSMLAERISVRSELGAAGLL